MTIIDKLKQSIESSTGLLFHYDDASNLNQILDDAVFPCVIAHLIDQGAIADTLGVYHERVTMEIWFENLAEEGADGLRNEELIDAMKRRALLWLTQFRNDENLRFISVNRTGRHYLQSAENYDVMATGFYLSVTFEEVEGVGPCDL